MYPPCNLNVVQLNIRGLVSKQAQVSELLNKLEKSLEIHALILCETWLTPINKKLIDINNYVYSGTERVNKKGGGTGFLLCKNVIFWERTDLKINAVTLEHHIIKIKCRKRNILLVSVYRSPNSPVKHSWRNTTCY